MAYYKNGCPDCHGFNFVTDYRQADVICSGCGLVQEGCMSFDDAFHNPDAYLSHAPLMTIWEKPFNADIDQKLKLFATHLQLPDQLQHEANTLFMQIRDNQTFRGSPLNAAILCSIYISCNINSNEIGDGIARDAKELCLAIGVDQVVFSKTLKRVYEIVPDVHAKMKTVSERDVLLRQIRMVSQVPLEKAWDVARETMKLDVIRRREMLLMGSPPNVVNAVLVFLACGKMKIALKKVGYVQDMCISRATLDKYVKLLNEKLPVGNSMQ